MLEVQSSGDSYVVFDTQANEPVMRFADRSEADKLVAELLTADIHVQLLRWSPDRVPEVY